jgi:ribosomal protein S18 acetylase RimI-like enzyme
MSAYVLRELVPSDLEGFLLHMERLYAESGRGGVPLFHARPDRSFLTEEERQKFGQGWQRPPGDAGWMRAWGALAEGRIVGHADLTADPIPTASHRVTLGLGVEQVHHHRGLGRSLLEMALSAAQAHRFCWLDLRVFAGNTPALVLYRQFGFVETGRVEDRFRIDGVSIANVSMTLPLAPVLRSPAGGYETSPDPVP